MAVVEDGEEGAKAKRSHIILKFSLYSFFIDFLCGQFVHSVVSSEQLIDLFVCILNLTVPFLGE